MKCVYGVYVIHHLTKNTLYGCRCPGVYLVSCQKQSSCSFPTKQCVPITVMALPWYLTLPTTATRFFIQKVVRDWTKHQSSVSLALCDGKRSVICVFSQIPLKKYQQYGNFDFFVICLNKLLNKQSSYGWSETLWRSCDVTLLTQFKITCTFVCFWQTMP